MLRLSRGWTDGLTGRDGVGEETKENGKQSKHDLKSSSSGEQLTQG